MSVYLRPGEDPQMAQAFRRARESFGLFWREMSWERRRIVPGVGLAAIKAAFPVPEPIEAGPTAEHMWVEDVTFDGRLLTGLLINTPDHIPELEAGMPVGVPLEEIEDWLYATAADAVCGGFTVQVTRAGLAPDALAEHDAAWGLGFLSPDRIALTPDQVQAGGMRYEEALPRALATEHPMSVNSTEAIERQLAGEPGIVHTVFDDGLSLLHLDALGGNLGPVQALLRAGADPSLRTPHGDTALDLARRLVWSRVVAALGG